MFRINDAILHVFDFVSCVNVFSQAELDLSSKATKSYVASHVRKAQGNVANMQGTFSADSAFAGEVSAYFAGHRDFVGLSVQVAQFLAGELGKADKIESTDLLVVDFENESDSRVGEIVASDIDAAAAEDVASEAADASYEGHGTRYLAILLLTSRQAFMHEVSESGSGVRTDLARHHAILPSPSQKVASYAIIEEGTLAVSFCDKERTIAGEKTMLIPDGLLQCSKEPSVKDVIDTVSDVVAEVVEKYDGSPTASTVALSRAKAAIAETSGEDEMISTAVVAKEAFADSDLMRGKFEEALANRDLPTKMRVRPKAAQQVVKSQRIKTDTGITLSFPAEYGGDSDYIEFVSEPDGLISIRLKNIGKIENR